jgi:hypothetical protein
VLLLLQVNWTVMKEWVAKRVTDLLGIEEEVRDMLQYVL